MNDVWVITTGDSYEEISPWRIMSTRDAAIRAVEHYIKQDGEGGEPIDYEVEEDGSDLTYLLDNNSYYRIEGWSVWDEVED